MLDAPDNIACPKELFLGGLELAESQHGQSSRATGAKGQAELGQRMLEMDNREFAGSQRLRLKRMSISDLGSALVALMNRAAKRMEAGLFCCGT
jgi:hypothetical protein